MLARRIGGMGTCTEIRVTKVASTDYVGREVGRLATEESSNSGTE